MGQVERILQGDSFQRSESLRRLLRYLADRSQSDEADQLKEYSIGMDVFAKGKDYDTRLDASVRIQVGRLRQKLADYYAADGINDEIVVSLPKGQFKLQFERRSPGLVAHGDDGVAALSSDVPATSGELRWRRVALVLAVVLVAAIIWGSISNIASRRANQNAGSELRWTAAMETFWGPFVQKNRPLIMAVGAPLFVGLRGCCFYRDLNNNNWDDAVEAPKFKAIKKALNDPNLFAGRSYTTVGDAKAAVLLGTLLGRRIPKLVFARSSDLSWQQLSDSNALFIGGTKTFGQLMNALPFKAEMILETTGLRILHPRQGEPGFMQDPTLGGAGLVAGDGEVHALISVLPGPNGRGFVGNFAANLGTGTFATAGESAEGFAASLGAGGLAAVEYATDPASVEDLVGRLKDKAGRVPRYFQVALSVTVKGGVPTSSRYLLSREVQLEQTVTAQR